MNFHLIVVFKKAILHYDTREKNTAIMERKTGKKKSKNMHFLSGAITIRSSQVTAQKYLGASVGTIWASGHVQSIKLGADIVGLVKKRDRASGVGYLLPWNNKLQRFFYESLSADYLLDHPDGLLIAESSQLAFSASELHISCCRCSFNIILKAYLIMGTSALLTQRTYRF
ncbi:hypothetical protein ACJX0J_006410, partial [Zea mays]